MFDVFNMAIQFGRCNSAMPGCTPDPGIFWANARGSTSTGKCGDNNHECPADHILTWPNLERVFALRTHHVEGSPFGERDVKWLLTVTFTRSATTRPLTLKEMVLLDRVLPKSIGYRDGLEEEEARLAAEAAVSFSGELALPQQVSAIEDPPAPKSDCSSVVCILPSAILMNTSQLRWSTNDPISV